LLNSKGNGKEKWNRYRSLLTLVKARRQKEVLVIEELGKALRTIMC